jgi:hypothetical protein
VRLACAAIVLGACGGEPSADITGPFSGTTHRFEVDRIAVALDETMAIAIAGDLDGDGGSENHFGTVTALLASISDLSLDGESMVASGAISSTVALVADDLTEDASAGLTFFGAAGEEATVAGGALTAGRFTSNRTATTRVPGRAILHVPVFTNADPLALALEGMEIDLAPDGSGGYDGVIRGGLMQQPARDAAYAGLRQMFLTEPQRHREFQRGVDTDRDGVMSAAELDASVIALLVTADIQLFEGDRYAPRFLDARPDAVSLAVSVHLTPCDAGRCTTAAPVNLCRDRIHDGDETDVDCGGSCQPCAGELACGQPADCQSMTCTASRCAPPSCTDGVHDGVESDRDCGGPCPACTLGASCIVDEDCASSSCVDAVCAAPAR